MDLLSTVRKTGSRGGVNFSWDDVATSAHRENYLGHSLKAPVGRWAKGRDLNWYAKADSTAADDSGETEQEKAARERREEIRKIKEAEEDAISRALGLPITPRNVTGANAVEVDGSKVPKREDDDTKDEIEANKAPRPTKEHRKDKDRHKDRHHRDSDKHHRRRHRSRDRHRNRTRSRSRSGVREGKRVARDRSVEGDRDRAYKSRRRSRSPEVSSSRRHERRRDDDQGYSRDYDRRPYRRRSRSPNERPRAEERRRSRSRSGPRYQNRDPQK